MTSELLGYLNMAIGIAGIVLTVLNTPVLVKLGADVSTENLPPEFRGIGGAIRMIGVLLVLITFIFLLALGMTMTLVPITRAMGASYPVLVAVLTVGTMYAMAATLALAVFRNPLSVPAVVGTFFLALAGLVSGVSEERSAFAAVVVLGAISFLTSGAISLMAIKSEAD